MRKLFPTLLPITLSLGAPCASGQQLTSLDHVPKSLMQQVLSEQVLAELLKATGGDDGLFRKVTGTGRLSTQKLFVSIPDAALEIGSISYPQSPEFRVSMLWDQAAMCQGTAPVAPGGKTKPTADKSASDDQSVVQTMRLAAASVNSVRSLTIPNSGTWSTVRVNDRAPEWAVDVEPAFDFSGEVPTQRYRFLPPGSAPAALPDTELKFSSPLTADYGTKVVYRQQVVMMRGRNLPFVATAQVTSAAPLQFNVRTLGQSADFSFRENEQRVMQLINLPADGTAAPAQDASLGARALQSPDGAYLLGRDSSGAYTVVDAMQSHRAAGGAPTLKRVWTSPARGSCADSDLALNTAGDLVFRCNATATYLYRNSDGSKPCRILTLNAVGQLMCYSDRVSFNAPEAAAKLVFSTRAAIPAANAGQAVVTQHAYEMTWEQLTGRPTSTFSFTGQYSGDRVISPVVSCKDPVMTLPSQPTACTQAVNTTNANVICQDTRTVMARLRGRSQDTARTQP